MYCAYKRELWTYTGREYNEHLQQWFDDMINWPSIEIKLIKDTHANTLIGFLIAQELTKEEQNETDCKWYISDAYIISGRRRQKFMTTAVYEFITKHKGNIGLVTINANRAATKFWDRIFNGLGYTKECLFLLEHDTESFYKFTQPDKIQKRQVIQNGYK